MFNTCALALITRIYLLKIRWCLLGGGQVVRAWVVVVAWLRLQGHGLQVRVQQDFVHLHQFVETLDSRVSRQ